MYHFTEHSDLCILSIRWTLLLTMLYKIQRLFPYATLVL
jgi:hypothetical protein